MLPDPDLTTAPERSAEARQSAGGGKLRTWVSEPARFPGRLDLRQLWRYRELLYFLAWRDVKVQYKQTIIGAAWAVLKPMLLMVVFTLFLGRLAGLPSGGLPYPVFVYAGLLPWILFATGLTSASNSVVGSEQLITKVYFPRIIIPAAAVAPALLDFLVASGLLVLLMMAYGVAPGWSILLLPLPVGLLVAAALAGGIFLAAVNVSYRDVRFAIPFLVQAWMFATPTIYMETGGPARRPADEPVAARSGAGGQECSLYVARRPGGAPVGARAAAEEPPHMRRTGSRDVAGVSGRVGWLLTLNPLTGVIAFFRAATIGGPLPWGPIGVASGLIAGSFFAACWYFCWVEDSFADII